MSQPVDAQDIELLQAALTTHTGLVFDDSMKPVLAKILEERLGAKRVPTVADYLDELMSSDEEAMELVRSLTVSETYFLRNSDQFRVVASWLRSEAKNLPTRRLRILSAGCSSGEEPYSLAMVLRENLPDIADWDVSICGIDINAGNLQKAAAARYSPWSLRETPADLRQRYFKAQGRHFVLDRDIRAMVSFEQRNLLDADTTFWRPECYDIVFCRNVLMYLSLDAAAAVVASIRRSMAPHGLLFLGHAENLRGISQDFHLLHKHGTFYYGREEVRDAGVVGDSVQQHSDGWRNWVEAIKQSTARIANVTGRGIPATKRGGNSSVETAETAGASQSLASAKELFGSERFAEALNLLASLPPSSVDDVDALLLKAILLTSGGDPSAAQAVCERLLEVDEFNAGAHYVMALCHEHAGDLAAAIEHDRTAVYLDPGFAMPHLHLGLLLRQNGDALAARRELSSAVGLMAREDPARILLFSGGFGREGLIELCRGELEACEPAS